MNNGLFAPMPQPGQPLPPGIPAQMPMSQPPGMMPQMGQGVPPQMPPGGMMSQMGQPPVVPPQSGQPEGMKYSVGDPIIDKYINKFLGSA